jgi:hypothetical protein
MTGIFISKGITPVIKAGDLIISMNEEGKSELNATLSLHYDTCPVWLKLSVGHLIQAKKWSHKRKEAFEGTDDNLKSEALEREFEHSMQSIISIGIAYDSFYATIKPKIKLDKDLTERWKHNRTSRHIQISETIRLGFKIGNAGTKILKQAISQIVKFRDLAIHPSGNIEQPVLHPELNIGVEWRFACFTYLNANMIVNEGLKRLRELLNIKGYNNNELETYCSGLLTLIAPVILEYEYEISPLK